MKSLFSPDTMGSNRSMNGGHPAGIMIMMVAICVLFLIAFSRPILEKRHFNRYSDDVIDASRLAEKIAGAEADLTDGARGRSVVMGQDGTTEFIVEKRMIPGPPGGGPRLEVIVKWMARGEEKQVYLTRALENDILTAAH